MRHYFGKVLPFLLMMVYALKFQNSVVLVSLR